MCLPGMMEQINPPTEKAKSCATQIKILMIVQLVFTVLKLFIGFQKDIQDPGGFTDLLTCFMLFCAYYSINFCACVMYIMLTLFNAVACFVVIGTVVQNPPEWTSMKKFQLGVVCASFIFYIVAQASINIRNFTDFSKNP